MTGFQSKKITCDGTVHKLSDAIGLVQSKFVQFLADPSNGSAVNIGGPDADSNGFPLVGGAAQLAPPNGAETFNFYNASQIYYYGANGTILYVLWGVG